MNLPGLVVDLPAVTAKDIVDLATARELGATFVFASFVQSAAAVREIRKHCTPSMRIISKIESQEGLDNYDAILSASDGIMVARGDLGVQIPAECVVLCVSPGGGRGAARAHSPPLLPAQARAARPLFPPPPPPAPAAHKK